MFTYRYHKKRNSQIDRVLLGVIKRYSYLINLDQRRSKPGHFGYIDVIRFDLTHKRQFSRIHTIRL